MTTESIISTLRQGSPISARLVREIITHLERIPAMERTIKALDHDFAQLSVAYSAATSRAESTVPFTREECGYVCEALEECERLREAVAWMLDTMDACTVAQTKIRLASIIESALSFHDARKTVETIL